MRYILHTIVILCTLSLGGVNAQSTWTKLKEDYNIQVGAGLQMWSTYTMGQQIVEDGQYVDVGDRLNFHLHRTRLSLKGQPYERLKFNITASLDFVGKDAYSAPQAGNNNGNSPRLGLWQAWAQWKAADALHVTMGYIPAQIGRENITGAFAVTSFEKAWSQNYLRRSLVGTGPGRTMGINIGGQQPLSSTITYSYDVGVYSTPSIYGDNTSGRTAAPLLVGRLALYFGDPESETYTIGHKVNYFGKRNGLTIAASAAQAGESDLWEKNQAYGVDALLNYGGLTVSGEWMWLRRSSATIASEGQTGFFRVGYNIPTASGHFIEPVFMIMAYEGGKTTDELSRAAALGTFAGSDQSLEIGMNYHLNPKLKVSLFYTANSGDAGESTEPVTFNNYFAQSGIGAIRRGDMLGLGVVMGF